MPVGKFFVKLKGKIQLKQELNETMQVLRNVIARLLCIAPL